MYSYSDLEKDRIELFSLGYKEEEIGKTVYARRISAFARGEGAKALIVGATHAREHITAKLVVDLAKLYKGDKIAFIPMLNPDGVELVIKGVESAPIEYRERIVRLAPNGDFTLWKANGRGVDINVNYDAGWGRGRTNLFYENYQNYVGEGPESEPETRSSVDYVLKKGIKVLVSYHAKGEVIYWSYEGRGNRKKAKALAQTTGYDLSYAYQSHGGFKDWFLKKGLGDAFTVEVGQDRFDHPYPYTEYGDILSQNVGVLDKIEEFLDDY
ncbi:MAG: hypothetical protein IJF76_05505 [Clostridia bacterium]|nr:hypothetical protein [Clostridia bacterium]